MLAQCGERVVLHAEELARTTGERFLDQLLLAAEVIIEERDVRFRA